MPVISSGIRYVDVRTAGVCAHGIRVSLKKEGFEEMVESVTIQQDLGVLEESTAKFGSNLIVYKK